MSNTTGTIEIIENFPIKSLSRKRTLRVYLPPEYDKNTNLSYPVLYMHDAQNLFDEKTSSFGACWEISDTLDEIYSQYSTGVIVVGIDNDGKKRLLEYSPWENKEIPKMMPHAMETDGFGGEGFLYVDFIVNELKPYIDNHFRTKKQREYTWIGGSSMGGLISLVAGLGNQDIFSKIAAFSTAGFFAQEHLLQYIISNNKMCNMEIYVDVGTKETSCESIKEFPQIYLLTNQQIYDTLLKAGFDQNNVTFKVFEGDIHNEKCWAKRFKPMIKAWLKV